MGTSSAKKLRKYLIENGLSLTPAEYRRMKKDSKPLAIHNGRSTYKRVQKIVRHQLNLRKRQEQRDKKRKESQ